ANQVETKEPTANRKVRFSFACINTTIFAVDAYGRSHFSRGTILSTLLQDAYSLCPYTAVPPSPSSHCDRSWKQTNFCFKAPKILVFFIFNCCNATRCQVQTRHTSLSPRRNIRAHSLASRPLSNLVLSPLHIRTM